jgi:hypothetical protein
VKSVFTSLSIPQKIEGESSENSDDLVWNPLQGHPEHGKAFQHRFYQDESATQGQPLITPKVNFPFKICHKPAPITGESSSQLQLVTKISKTLL